MKLLYVPLILLFLFVSCSDDDDNAVVCGVVSPLEDLSWLRTEVENRLEEDSEDLIYCYITEGTYRGQTVFLYKDCNPTAFKVVPVYDCEGSFLGALGTQIDAIEIEEECVIWRAPGFVC
ncbi:MAG: hypothetical protein AAF361_08520, partial [Bacteroidota bacterium]